MRQDHLELMMKGWALWIWSYLIIGGITSIAGGTSFLAEAVDLDIPTWVKLTFLNLPLQIGLVIAASILIGRSRGRRPTGLTLGISIVVSILIIGNLLVALVSLVA